MRFLLLALILAGPVLADQVCYKTAAKEVCYPLSDDLLKALETRVLTQVDGGGKADYRTVPHLIFEHLRKTLFMQVMRQFPSPALEAAKAAVVAAEAAAEQERTSAAGDVPEGAKTDIPAPIARQ